MADATSVLVLGAGAIGAFYGGVLARAGCEVSVVARSDHDIVSRDGFRIDSTLGDLSFRPVRALQSSTECGAAPDVLLVALKLVPGLDRSALIRPACAPGTTIVLVQNGIGIEEEIAQAFASNALVSGVAYAAVNREAPGQIRHHSQFTRLILGPYPAGSTNAAQRVAGLLQAGGGRAQVVDDIVGARWQKCAWNTVFNPISALGDGLGTRDILSGPEQIAFVRAAIGEVCAIAAADGHPLPADTIDRQIEGTLRMPNYISSMGQDWIAGRDMETDALIGNAVRIARHHGLAAPRLEGLYAMLRMAESKRADRTQPAS